MKRLYKQLVISFLILSFITGCVVSNLNYFATVEPSSDSTYGYTPENPVTIKNVDLGHSINSSHYFISRLRTEKGNTLNLILIATDDNPNYKKPAIALQNRYTGEPLNYGTGPLLDLYILKPENEMDTIKIYINPYLKGTVKVPVGLKFEKE